MNNLEKTEAKNKVLNHLTDEEITKHVGKTWRWLDGFLHSKWKIILGLLVLLRPLWIGAPALLAATLLYLVYQIEKQDAISFAKLEDNTPEKSAFDLGKWVVYWMVAGILFRVIILFLAWLLFPGHIHLH